MNISPDTVLAMFKEFLNQGKTLTEARNEFSNEQWKSAILESIELQGVTHPLFEYGVQESQQSGHQDVLESQCYELWMRGWITEDNGRKESWAWYWRRPPIGNRKKGKLFLSTNQAFQSLQK
jgi:hypothetical protein